MAISPSSLMGQSPSFQSSSSAAASARSGDVTSSFMSGDFSVGNSNKDLVWIVGIIAAAVAIIFIGKGK